MKLYDYPEAKQVIVSGDIHGNFKGIVYKLCVQYGCTDTLLIIAGDCGFGFEKPGYYEQVYGQVAGRLRKANNWVVFVRGNHDDPSYFAEQKIDHARWRTVPDYSVIQACGHNILCAGGGVSIDRKQRQEENARLRERGHVQTAYWWKDEMPEFRQEEIDAIPAGVDIDTVVTHTAPSFCQLQQKAHLKSWLVLDPGLHMDIHFERKEMDYLLEALKDKGHSVERWYYGHFHQSWSASINGTLYSMLDCEEFKELPGTGDKPAPSDDIIPLHNRNGLEVYLKKVAGQDFLYELVFPNDFVTITGDDPIVAVDPFGGPFLAVGNKLAHRTIGKITKVGKRIFIELT